MYHSKKIITIITNDYHANLPEKNKKIVPQGGPARFAQLLELEVAQKKNSIRMVSLVFTHEKTAAHPKIRKISGKQHHLYYELIYNGEKLGVSYRGDYSKKEYVHFLDSMINQVMIIMQESGADGVLLNGFSLSNWIMLEAASRLGIPAHIQHAGIWKKEIRLARSSFSPAIRRIFSSFEKDTVRKTKTQIFLNHFSRQQFLKLHRIAKNHSLISKMKIIPLPVEQQPVKKFRAHLKSSVVIGMVARWDAIKNHAAFRRLAQYASRKQLPFEFRCVTKAPPSGVSQFFESYKKLVSIIPPMNPAELVHFYKSCDVLIVPSRFDVSPTVVIEALTQGIPVIVSRNTGWVDVYKKFNLDAMIVSPWSSGERLAHTVQDLQKHYSLYRTRYEQLRTYLLAEHKPSRVFAQYFDLFT